jgi:hypothetical protein
MPDPNPRALAAVRYSRLALGKPYIWGGTDYDKGVDCSGLVYTAYLLGAHMPTFPRTSQAQYNEPSFRPVPVTKVIPGDLVFAYMEAGGPGHVVMAIGGGNVIAAPHTGTNIQIQTISHFGSDLIKTAKRPLPAVGEGPYTGGQVIGSGASGASGGASGGGGSSSFAFVGAISDGLSTLADPHTWYRVGQVLLGAIAVLAGILIFAKNDVATIGMLAATKGMA